ncbi:S58 family peptidase [Nocardia brasiliensis]|uniref:S58 family peptidase n=1 Tax=Nocardia brasiliensis TaxID=37326 RepID=A0A6G9XU27_NOCBR|nr:P1 family peptidase [Nocardia brasiliensis]QIS04461.1 S58 family peptidase [Nocardia brasiliensis]
MTLRAREHGLEFTGVPGQFNAITDVPGVQIGYTTLIRDENVRTGVTAILPRGRDGVFLPCAAGWYALNGNGEMTGTTWLTETGALSLPVLLTNTHAVGTCHRGIVDWLVGAFPDLPDDWALPVVAETWDGYLNDINGAHVSTADAVAAIDAATGGPVAEGSVGGGTGMNCYGFKGGNGTASRRVGYGVDTYTVGAFVQANFGARRELVIRGVPVGARLQDDNPLGTWSAPAGSGSVIVVLAIDAPLLPGQLTALARRVPLGLARTGTTGSHFSGDIFLAFSTANEGALTSSYPDGETPYEQLRFIPWGQLNPFYEAAVEAVEEAVLNALFAGRTMVGRNGHRSPGLPVQAVLRLLGRDEVSRT